MASLSFVQFSSLPRWHSNWPFFPSSSLLHIQDYRLQSRWFLAALSKEKDAVPLAVDASGGEVPIVEKKARRTTTQTTKQASARRRKKAATETAEENSRFVGDSDVSDVHNANPSVLNEDSPKTRRRTRRKAASASSSMDEGEIGKVTRRRRTRKKVDDLENQGSETELSDREDSTFIADVENDSVEDIELYKEGEEDISFTYGWPPLVCCFGSAQHAFVPSGRQANRLVDYEMHERMEDALWTPKKFVRSPGSCASNVALVLASLGGKVAFMGKLGDDDFGQSLLYYLNINNVQTRSVRIDGKRVTAVSQMKIAKRGGLRMTCVKPCAEDCLSRSEINVDVLKEAKMFYFSTYSLLDRNTRSTVLYAIKISKKLGGTIFYDVNLPMPMWHSGEETKMFIQQAWESADFIEVTKQELEFICGIKPFENFDSKDNDRMKFIHYEPEVVAPLWHENLKVLFVTNGTSKIHYYTNEHNGSVLGMEDPPVTPFTCDMSASGDSIVAALMRKLTLHPHLTTDKKYLEHSIQYAINSGVRAQWLQARTHGYPPKEGMEDSVSPDINGIRSISEREYRTLVRVS